MINLSVCFSVGHAELQRAGKASCKETKRVAISPTGHKCTLMLVCSNLHREHCSSQQAALLVETGSQRQHSPMTQLPASKPHCVCASSWYCTAAPESYSQCTHFCLSWSIHMVKFTQTTIVAVAAVLHDAAQGRVSAQGLNV